ncbi:MAG: ribosome maturation factor RimM [Sphingomonadales bacterium]|jgi:16S rRNA processing protein RimM
MAQAKGSRMSGDNPDWFCVARLGASHGVRGDLKVEALTEDAQTLRSLKSFHKGAAGEAVSLKLIRPHKTGFIGHIDGINSPEAAKAWNGVELYVPRDALPALEGEDHYHADLIGMAVKSEDGDVLGEVIGVTNFGAGDILEISREKGVAMLPFTREAVLDVKVEDKEVIIDSDFLT